MSNNEQEYLAWLEKLARKAETDFEKTEKALLKLREEMELLQREKQHLGQAVHAARRMLGLQTEPAKELSDKETRFRDMSHGDAAEIAMQEAGGQMRIVDLIETLRAGGKELTNNAYQIFLNTLNRDPRFVKVAPGLYGLIGEK